MSDENPKIACHEDIVAAIANAICDVMGNDLYVQKTGYNAFHKYNYATAGALTDILKPALAKAGLAIIPNEVSKEWYKDDTVVAVTYEFTLLHRSGAVWPEKPRLTGLAAWLTQKGTVDDKAFNKCFTAAEKYFLLKLFKVPTGDEQREPLVDGDPDEDDNPTSPDLLPEAIEKFEIELKEKLEDVADAKSLDVLWRSGVNARLRDIGTVNQPAQKRMIAYFTAKKVEFEKQTEPQKQDEAANAA